ncbi:unnamed protein product [Amoebophrya sp. A120]|nr:unnamed protein product [Amoebophrya sp. A120]|eukprot:GSA120T00015090001.1
MARSSVVRGSAAARLLVGVLGASTPLIRTVYGIGENQPWPIGGILDYKCKECHCPDPSLADQILTDLESSCNIPKSMGLGTVDDVSAGVTESLIYHSKWTQTSQVHPDLMDHLCISPICRWRIEMAYDAFAECDTLDLPEKAKTTSWRHYSELSLTVVKHFVMVLKSSKEACKSTTSPKNIHTGALIHQKLQITGIDVRSDTTMREGELAFRMALASLLDVPMRRLDVRLEMQPELCKPDAEDNARDPQVTKPHAFRNPVCEHSQCGYGQCVSNEDGDGYTCLCNECYKLGTVNGYQTCVPDEICFFKNPCDTYPSPCKCGSQCEPCPECTGQKFQCKCGPTFSGPTCETLVCPKGFSEAGAAGGQCGSCQPMDATNPCDPNPCKHDGVCKVEGEEKTYVCQCPADYTGPNCETLVCPDGFFEEAGKCVSVQTGAASTAETAADPCAKMPCKNGGECIPDGEYYSCACPPLYSGTDCEYKENPCDADPCDGTKCIPDDTTALGYYCQCEDCAHGDSTGFFGFRFNSRLLQEMAKRRVAKRRRRMQVTTNQDAMLYNWDAGRTVPGTRPLASEAMGYGGVDKIAPHCAVYQNAPNMGAEVTLSIKCPKNDIGDGVDCADLMSKVTRLQTSSSMQKELTKRARNNCVATDVHFVSSPTEEIQIADCPSTAEFDFRWNKVWAECEFEKLGFAEDDPWKVYIGHEGVETLDMEYLPLLCHNPVCRGMAMDLSGLFTSCSNSAPGYLGRLARKAKALKNSLKVCGNPSGAVMSRQQVAVVGVLDPLSKSELLHTEAFVEELIVNATGIATDRVVVLTQPVLHVNDFWSQIPQTPNVVGARSAVAMGPFRPVSLAGLQYGETPHAKVCLGLCIATASPGPDPGMTTDPAAPLELTFSEPIKMGDCLTTGYCKISLKPYNSAYGYYNLDATVITSEIVVAGMSVKLKPRSFLKANANYTVEIEEGAFEGEKTGEIMKKTAFWFLTGPPTSSVVKVSVMLGCDDHASCHYYTSYLPDFVGDIEGALIQPLQGRLKSLRSQKNPEPDNFDENGDQLPTDLIPAPERRRVLQAQAQRLLSSTEDSAATAGDPVVEGRKPAKCETVSTWFLMCVLSMVPLFLSFVTAALAGRAITPWVQDVRKEGYQKTFTYAQHVDGGWKSKLIENPRSFSARLAGPWLYLPLLMLLSLGGAATVAIIFINSTDDVINYMAAVMSMSVAGIIWNLFSICVSTWVAPGYLPFQTDSPKQPLQAGAGLWNLGSKHHRSPLSLYPIPYGYSEKPDYDVEGHENQADVDDMVNSVNINVPRHLAQSTGAMSRLTKPIPEVEQIAKICYAIAVFNSFVGMMTLTGLAMQLCPQPVSMHLVQYQRPSPSNCVFFVICQVIIAMDTLRLTITINQVQFCSLFGFSFAVGFVILSVSLMKQHTFQPVVAVSYKQDNREWLSQSYLAHDVQFQEQSNKVVSFNHLLPQAASSEGVLPGYELVQIIERQANGIVKNKRDLRDNDDARNELNYFERYGNEVTLLFKASYYPLQKDVTRFERSNPYLPPLVRAPMKKNLPPSSPGRSARGGPGTTMMAGPGSPSATAARAL